MLTSLRSIRDVKSATSSRAVSEQSQTPSQTGPAMPTLSKQVPQGLFVLYPTKDTTAQEYDTDIIAIHSLGGHPYTTWTHDSPPNHLWLRDSLPSHVPTARIMTFSYDSAATWCSATTGLDEVALELLKQIHTARRGAKAKARKIIFVCHGLGGLIFKKTLLLADNMKEYKHLLERVTGALFMATPHRESQSTANTERILNDVVNCARLESSVRLEFLEQIKVAAKVFREISEQVRVLLERLQVVSMYEQEELAPFGKLIVEPFSAILGLPQEIVMPAVANHRTIVRFSSSADKTYKQVWSAIADIVSNKFSHQPDQYPSFLSTGLLPAPITKRQSDAVDPEAHDTLSAIQDLGLESSMSRSTISSAQPPNVSRAREYPATMSSGSSRSMPASHRATARMIQARLQNYADTRVDSGVRAHGAASHARRAQQERLTERDRQSQVRELDLRLQDQNQVSRGGIESWRNQVNSAQTEERD